MQTRAINTTPEQDTYRDAILKKKKRKPKPPPYTPQPTTRDYMNNCLYWIGEAMAGRRELEKGLSATKALYEHFKTLINANR